MVLIEAQKYSSTQGKQYVILLIKMLKYTISFFPPFLLIFLCLVIIAFNYLFIVQNIAEYNYITNTLISIWRHLVTFRDFL